MVSTEQLLAFGVTALILIAIPGPSVVFTVGRALAYGRRVALSTVVGNSLGLLVVLSLVTFVVYASIPVEPAGFLVDLQHATPAQIAAAHQALGLDHSLLYRYGTYLEGLTHGDFGTAWSTLVIGESYSLAAISASTENPSRVCGDVQGNDLRSEDRSEP